MRKVHFREQRKYTQRMSSSKEQEDFEMSLKDDIGIPRATLSPHCLVAAPCVSSYRSENMSVLDRALQSMSADSVILGGEGGIVVIFPLAVIAFLAVNPSSVIVALLLTPKGNMAS
jgi:hypothetical protein